MWDYSGLIGSYEYALVRISVTVIGDKRIYEWIFYNSTGSWRVLGEIYGIYRLNNKKLKSIEI